MSKPNLLFAASEVFPFAKSGGLADVAHSLPRALSNKYDVTVVMPLYQFVDREKFNITSLETQFDIVMDEVHHRVELYGCNYDGVDYTFVYSKILCDRTFLYGPAENGYEDNAIRFAIFNYAIIKLLKYQAYAIAHLNDWQCALVPLLVSQDKTITTKTVYTIHNLSYQGLFDHKVLKEIGISEKYFNQDALEFYSKVNFTKAGIAFSDAVTTVSPRYAEEILTSEFGCGLEGFLRYHSSKLVGIINGIDTEHFSPSDDKALVKPYDGFDGKIVNKKAYLKQVGLKGVKKPLFIFIGRFTWQKGIDLLIQTLPKIASLGCNIAILGEGEPRYYDELKEITNEYKNVHVELGYDESLSHKMYAAADFLLMPSLFEPCGLNQFIAMHYGTIPVVHSVGGLADTVYEEKRFDRSSGCGYGVLFCNSNESSFVKAVVDALEIYDDKQRHKRVVMHNMKCDFSWRESAKIYIALYNKIVQLNTGKLTK